MTGQRVATFICVGAMLLTLGAAPAHAYIATDRWTRTATDGTDVGTQGSPITLTWSFAPDATDIPGNTFGTVDSNLISFLDTNWGVGPGGGDLTQRPWFFIFQQSFARISAISGVTYDYEPNDDGNDFSGSNTPNARGVLGTRGDIRLGGKSYGAGSNVLASNYFPNYGEMMINTDQGSFFTFSNNNYRRFR